MSFEIVPPEAEEHLDWIALTDALAAGHSLRKAEIGDTFLYRDPDTLLSRAAWIDGLGMAVKTATIFPGNAAQGKPNVGGAVSVFSDVDGGVEAILDFSLVTKWKTAGDSLLAVRRLARPESEVILLVGAGTVARSLREAYAAVWPGARFMVWSRSPDSAMSLAGMFDRTEAVRDLERGVAEADIIACATMATDPILKGGWLRPGQHVDLIGAYRPDMREADDAVLQRGCVFVDSFDTTLDHIGELKTPLATGAITRADVVADFYDLAAFTRAPDDITVFKNGGGAHLDLMTSRYILAAWQAR